MSALLLFLAGVRESNLASEPANMTSCHLPSQFQTLTTTPPLPRDPGSQRAALQLSPQGRRPSRTELIHKLPGCSHQLLSQPSQNTGYRLVLHPWQVFRAPHSTWPESILLLQEVGIMGLSGDPGCGRRSQESPLYSLAFNLVLQLWDLQVRKAEVLCRRGQLTPYSGSGC